MHKCVVSVSIYISFGSFFLFICFVPFRFFVSAFYFLFSLFVVCLFSKEGEKERVWNWVTGEVTRIWENLGKREQRSDCML